MQTSDPPRTRTWNLRLRGPTPYPLGQRASTTVPLWHCQGSLANKGSRQSKRHSSARSGCRARTSTNGEPCAPRIRTNETPQLAFGNVGRMGSRRTRIRPQDICAPVGLGTYVWTAVPGRRRAATNVANHRAQAPSCAPASYIGRTAPDKTDSVARAGSARRIKCGE